MPCTRPRRHSPVSISACSWTGTVPDAVWWGRKHAGNAAWYQAQAALHEASVPIYGVPVQTREIFGVFHLKGFVIDDTVIYSGASLNNVYPDKLGQYRYDRYHLIRQRDLAQAMSAWMTGMLSANLAVRRLDQPTLPDPAH